MKIRYARGDRTDELFARLGDLRKKNPPLFWYVQDRQMSVIALLTKSGMVEARLKFIGYPAIPFDPSKNGVQDRYQYTGREYDYVSQVIYYRTRWLSPRTNRFLQEDPIGFAGGDSNLYRPMGNNPAGHTDPYGLQPDDAFEEAVNQGNWWDRWSYKLYSGLRSTTPGAVALEVPNVIYGGTKLGVRAAPEVDRVVFEGVELGVRAVPKIPGVLAGAWGGALKGGEKFVTGLIQAGQAIYEDPWHAPGRLIREPFEAPMRGAAMLWNSWDQTWSNTGANLSRLGQYIAANPNEAFGEIAFDLATAYFTGRATTLAQAKVLPRGLLRPAAEALGDLRRLGGAGMARAGKYLDRFLQDFDAAGRGLLAQGMVAQRGSASGPRTGRRQARKDAAAGMDYEDALLEPREREFYAKHGKPPQRFDRTEHYGDTPTRADRRAKGAKADEVVDHDPPLVVRYYEGDPRIGEKPGYLMTPQERAASAADRSRMRLMPAKQSQQQGLKLKQYAADKARELGL